MGEQWHYSRGGQQAGPISAAELKQLASSGKLSRTDMVWKDGMPNWVPAEKINGLFAAPAASTPPPVPSSPPSLPSDAPATSLIAGLHRQRFAIAVAAGVGMLATFLPWVHAPIVGSVSGTAGDGWITLALFIPAMVLALRGAKLHPIVGGARLGATIPAGIAALIGLYKIADLKSRMADVPRDNPFAKAMSASVQVGIGIYVLIAAGVALAVLAWVLAKPPQDKPA